MIFGHFLLGIFGNIYLDGSGTSRAGDIECLGDGCRDIGGMPYLAVPFGYSLGDPYEVGFLKSIGAQETGTYLSADQNDRSRIHHRVGKACYRIGSSGTRSDDTDTGTSAYPGIALGGM